jgi:hypothetical protein
MVLETSCLPELMMFVGINVDKLVGGLEHEWIMTFHSIGNLIFPTDEVHHFSEG